MSGAGRPVVIGCRHTATRVLADGEGLPDFEYREVPCLGSLDPLHALRALDEGAPRVVAVGCYVGRCRHMTGSQRAQRVVVHVGDVLEEAGLDRHLVGLVLGSPLQPEDVRGRLIEFFEGNGGGEE